jgi:hypothetical protein
MENNGTAIPGTTATPGGTTTGSSGHTQPLGQPTDQTTMPSAQRGTETTPQPSGATTLQMLKGPISTEHLQRVVHLYWSITHMYNSIPKDSSTLLPSIDSYITTLALATLSNFNLAP